MLKGYSIEKRGEKAAHDFREIDGNCYDHSFPSNSGLIIENQAAHILRRFDGNDLDRGFPSNFSLFLPNQTAQAYEDEVRNYRVQQNPVYLSDSVELLRGAATCALSILVRKARNSTKYAVSHHFRRIAENRALSALMRIGGNSTKSRHPEPSSSNQSKICAAYLLFYPIKYLSDPRSNLKPT